MDVYQIVTDRIIQLLDQGTVPWKKPWNSAGGLGDAVSYTTQKSYRGINALLLPPGEYITFNQVKSLQDTAAQKKLPADQRAKVKPGAKGHLVVFYAPLKPRQVTGDDGEIKSTRGAVLRYYYVFDIKDCQGVPSKRGAPRGHDPIPEAEAVVDGYHGPQVHLGGAGACYYPSTDTVGMPAPDRFDQREGYYSTLFHELVHSTGHRDRLDRFDRNGGDTQFGSYSYSKEELVAEIGAAFLCGHVGISPKTVDNSASYIQHWRSRLAEDSRLIVQSAAKAQKAADWILHNGKVNESTSEL